MVIRAEAALELLLQRGIPRLAAHGCLSEARGIRSAGVRERSFEIPIRLSRAARGLVSPSAPVLALRTDAGPAETKTVNTLFLPIGLTDAHDSF